jgi:hypothetical protein
MKSEGKIQVVVRSRKTPIGTVLRTEPIYSTSGLLVGYRPSVSVLYRTSIDEDHRRTLAEAQKLASSLGIGLEVIDESRLGLLSGLLHGFGLNTKSWTAMMPSSPKAASDPSPAVSNGC